MRSIAVLLVLAFVSLAQALSSSGTRLLVVLEDLAEKDNYSKFWQDLESRGYSVSFESPKNEKLALVKYNERAYDHLILFPPKSKGLGPNLTPNTLLDFLSKDGNILLSLSANSPAPSSIISMLLELDIHLASDRNNLVVDHFNHDTLSAGEKHDVLLVPLPKPLREDVVNYFSGDGTLAIPRAVGHSLGNASPLLAPILRAPSTAYSYNPKDEGEAVEEPFAVGEQLALISAMQARNSARLTVLGSVEMLADKWFDADVKRGDEQVKTANRGFATELSAWTFKELGVLKVGRLQHYLNEGSGMSPVNDSSVGASMVNPKMYRIKNDVTFSIELSEYTMNQYSPFNPPAQDSLQLEFTMLSPFYRLPLHPTGHTSNSTIFSTSFRLPDQHGIFNFRVNYKRPFLTNVDEKRTVTVRHYAHDEWPRSWAISAAWTWIAGVGVTVVGWLGFVIVWLYSEPVREKKGGRAQ